MAITNTQYKVCERELRRDTGQGDYETQPRILQPVISSAAVTVANGFTTQNLRPGDQVLIALDSSDSPSATRMWTRNETNDGWYKKRVIETASSYTITNVNTDRAYDADATTLDEIADVLGTLIADLRLNGLTAT